MKNKTIGRFGALTIAFLLLISYGAGIAAAETNVELTGVDVLNHVPSLKKCDVGVNLRNYGDDDAIVDVIINIPFGASITHYNVEVHAGGGYKMEFFPGIDLTGVTESTNLAKAYVIAPGNTAEITEMEFYLPTPPKLDLVFAIDTTDSMRDDIVAVKASATQIVDALDSKGVDYRVAVVDYRDFPVSPFGGSGDYPYNLGLPFSADRNTIVGAINGLNLGWGANWEESVYTALVRAMTDVNKDPARADNYGWREGAEKGFVLLGDAPGHNPDPFTGYTLADVTSLSESIDPVKIYSIAVGYSPATYAFFSEISEATGGKAYVSPTADDVVDAILAAIGDIGTGQGVSVNITPDYNEANPGSSVVHSVNVTNAGDSSDKYSILVETENIAGFYRGYPLAIPDSWINFDSSEIELDPGKSEIRSLTINVPDNWAGMENVPYDFSVTAKSGTDTSISNSSSAELVVKANKRSMIEYSKLEIQWLSETVNSSSVAQEIKKSLLVKLAGAEAKLDQVIADLGSKENADNGLKASQNIINAFLNQVNAQYDKKVSQPDATELEEKAKQIMEDINKAIDTT